MRRLAVLLLSLLLNAGCFSSAPGQSLNSAPCPSISGVPNLRLADISPEALPYLKKYSLPADQADFCRYLERLQKEHQSKIEEGLIDMMGDYFWATQTIETGYSFSYKMRQRPIPQIIQDRASSEDQMADRFMKAIDEDKDVKRKALFDDFIQKLSSPGKLPRKEGVVKLMKLIFDKSWVFKSEFQSSVTDVGVPTNYGFVERGLRTTSPITVAALVDQFINSATAKQSLPDKISRVLIIGPGLQFSDPEAGEEIPQESHEPFTLMDSLLRSGKAAAEALQVDLLDINPRVIEHVRDATNSDKPYILHVVMNTEAVPSELLDYGQMIFGSSLPGAMSSKAVQGKSRRPSSGRLEPAEMISRALTIPATIVKRLHPFQGDMTTTDLRKLAPAGSKKYDAIFCFDTLIYLSESERMLAGINIREALADNGVFVTDNRLETDTGDRPGRKDSAGKTSAPIFDKSFFDLIVDYNHADGSNMGPVTKEGRRTVVYRRGKL